MVYRIFVSHGWTDKWVAKQMARCIRDAGAEPFIDIFDIDKGDRIERKIQDELPNCNELIVLLTPWSARRNWVWAEVGAAWSQKMRTVGILYGLTSADVEKKYGGDGSSGTHQLPWLERIRYLYHGTQGSNFEPRGDDMKIFISYGHGDGDFATQLGRSFAKQGVSPHLSGHESHTGSDWPEGLKPGKISGRICPCDA